MVDSAHVTIKGSRRYVRWTPELIALLGTMADEKLAKQIGFTWIVVARKRKKLGIQSYRSTLAESEIPCALCGKAIHRRMRDRLRSKRLFCSKRCANAAQKKRDSEALRYGAGWKGIRKRVRDRDATCRGCGAPPVETALHVHHLKPFRFGGANAMENLVALCEQCHHKIEAFTSAALESIPINVSLAEGVLTISAMGQCMGAISVVGAGAPPANGLTVSEG
jgi:hypothetical protein